MTSLIIGWATPERRMMPLANGSIAILGATQSFDENTTENHQYLSNFYIKHCFNPYYHFKQRLEYMVFLQNYCFAKKIKIVYFLSTKEEINDKILWELSEEAFMSRSSKDIELSGIKNNFGILKKLISQIRDEIWVLRPWYSMSEHCAPYEHLECGHPAEEGSSSWADIIKKYL